MANKAKIGASIVLDGEKKYKEAVTGCNNKLKELRAELGLVKEKYVENANSMEALKKKAEILKQISAEQKKKQKETQEAYDHAKYHIKIKSCLWHPRCIQKDLEKEGETRKRAFALESQNQTDRKLFKNSKRCNRRSLVYKRLVYKSSV